MEGIGILVILLVLACALGAIFFRVSGTSLQTSESGVALGNPQDLAIAQAALDSARVDAIIKENESDAQAKLALENQKAQATLDFNAQKLQGTLEVERQKLQGTLTVENSKLAGTATVQALESQRVIDGLNAAATSQAQVYEENLRRVREEAISTRTYVDTKSIVVVGEAQTQYTVGTIENKGNIENAIYNLAMTVIKIVAFTVFVLYAYAFVFFFTRKWSSINPNNK